MEFHYRAIGVVHSCFKEKFGIPRQAGLVPDARGTLELFEPFNRKAYLEGLEGFSHIWLQYVFHAAAMAANKSKVRPPRLGGNRRVGVFGTRSNFRPNPIGLSLVALEGIAYDGGAHLRLKGIDLLDQTPVLDIKPYIPYADCRPERRQLARLLVQVIQLDPRPAYYGDQRPKQAFGMHLGDWNVRWRLDGVVACVIQLEPRFGRPILRDIA